MSALDICPDFTVNLFSQCFSQTSRLEKNGGELVASVSILVGPCFTNKKNKEISEMQK